MAKKKSSIADFESALTELETLVEKMESGEQSLEEALHSFQRGVELTRTCQQGLKDAQQQVDKLTKLTEDSGTEAFAPED
ncbi:MAG: exodeoxyribonuclease VII small subunit [Proteobacteria bacterium]|nr:exodeoxyribonuclease VII small subunit [Pseudomonadota bacterium]